MNIFLTALRNLEIVDPSESSFEIMPGINFTNSVLMKSYLINDIVVQAIGVIEHNYILQSKNLAFYKYDIEDFRGLDNDTYLIIVLSWLEELLKNSWLVKDNCIDCDFAFLGRGLDTDRAICSSNFLASKRNMADGSRLSVAFTLDELQVWADLHNKSETYYFSKNSNSPSNFMLQRNFSRIGRSMEFIKAARSATNLAYKLSHYCSAFESILTTDSSELSHKLSERAAFFLQENFPDKLDTYNTLKQAYNVRSKLTHGDFLKESQIEKVPELSFACDNLLRATILKILNDDQLLLLFDGNNEKIDNYFNQLIFSS